MASGHNPMRTHCARASCLLTVAAALWGVHLTIANAYVDPIYADNFEAFACTAADNPQPNVDAAEEPGSGGCPAGMVLVDTFCVDRYEAALIDDTPGNNGAAWSPYFNPGSTAVHAVSAYGAVPQGYISQIQAGMACVAAGKRLCSDTEWLRACEGPGGTTYPYGNTYVGGACNDTRATNPVIDYFGAGATFDSGELSHPCLNQLRPGLDRAGANAACVSAEGAYDLAGNLNEWTIDPAGTFRGGYYVNDIINGPGCLFTTTAHDTSYHDYSTGFRCCADPPSRPLIVP
jgi:formylglycine-generating enzyme